MPELPEVETVRRGLKNLIIGKKIVSVNYDWVKSFPNDPMLVNAFLLNATIVDIRRRAKLLMIDLASDFSLVVHLRMTGQLVYRDLANPQDDYGAGHPSDSLVTELPDKTTRVTFDFSDGSKLFFNDQRKFGYVQLLESAAVEDIPFMKKVGPEPLSAEFDGDLLAKRLERRKGTTIKAALLDQTVVAGIGNIYADESLILSRIHPATRVAKLSKVKINRLAKNIKIVLQKSIDLGGSSSRNYVNASGLRGDYLAGAYAYKRNGEPCRVCGAIIQKIRVAGRGTHICPRCQKIKK